MSAILEAAIDGMHAQKMNVRWEIEMCPVSGQLTPVISVDFADGSTAHCTPDEARAFGIAMIEASGLALGAWGQRQREHAEDWAEAALLADLADDTDATRTTTLQQWDAATAATMPKMLPVIWKEGV